jgi:hypothetical protein
VQQEKGGGGLSGRHANSPFDAMVLAEFRQALTKLRAGPAKASGGGIENDGDTV